MENKANIRNCDGCNKNVDKLFKTYVNDQPAGEQYVVSSYWLCQECYKLRFADPEAFLKTINECYSNVQKDSHLLINDKKRKPKRGTEYEQI
jgi:hypothetical protein